MIAALTPLLAQMARHRTLLALGALLALVTAAAGLATLASAGWYLAGAALTLMGAAGTAASLATVPALALRIAVLLRPLTRYGERVVGHEGMFRALSDLRMWIFARLVRLDPADAMRLSSGEVLSRLTADIEALDGLYLRLAVPLLGAALVGGTATALLLAASPLLGLCAAAFLGLCGGLLPWVSARAAARASAALQPQAGVLRQAAVGFAQGLTELQLAGATPRAAAALAAEAAQLAAAQNAVARIAALGHAAVLATSGLLVTGAALALALAARQPGSHPVAAVTGLFLLLALAELVAPLPAAWQNLRRIRSAAERLQDAVSAPRKLADPPHPAALPAGHALALHQVAACWPGRPETLLRIAHLELPAGARIGIAGASGAGKSTLLALLRRRLAPLTGTVTLDGVPLLELSEADIARDMAVMTQRPDLFQASLRDNLLLAAPEADSATLLAALDAAGLGPLVRRLPEGLDTAIGEHGMTLSGGEARRVALARLHLRPDARILLLDEPTEGLDSATEADVLDRLLQLQQHRTLIVVTHRPAVLARMQRVVTVAGGSVTG